MKRTETYSIGEAIRLLLDVEPEMHEAILEQRALKILPETLGMVARYVTSSRIAAGVLTLRVNSSAVKQALLLDRAALIRKINDAVGAELLHDLVVY